MAEIFNKDTEMQYFVQKVLPQAYSDALSYEEVLYQVVAKLNSIIANNNNLPDYISATIQSYISSGAIGEVVNNILTNFMLNVKNPPLGILPASGDGSTDDTLAIQGCIDYANEHGGKCVYFPSGVYLTQSLTLKSNVSLCGMDSSTTRIVLKGGATKPLLSGTASKATISRLTFDGNMDIQVNNIDLISLTGSDLLFSDIELLDGYNLLKIEATGNVIGENVLFGKAVVDALVMSGTGVVNFDGLVFEELSTLNGRYVINNSVNNAVFEDIYSVATTSIAIKNTGNKCVFVGQVFNASTVIADTGTSTFTNFYSNGGSSQKDVADEKLARETADALLQQHIDKEVTDRGVAETALQQDITDETNARTQAINSESQARISADNTLQQNIDAEATARGQAVSAESNARNNADSTLQQNIDAEALARANADTVLQGNINTLGVAVGNMDALTKVFKIASLPNGTDDTSVIQGEINSLVTGMTYVFRPNSVYIIDETVMLKLKGNATYILPETSVIQCKGHTATAYSLVIADGVSNVLLTGGGTIKDDRALREPSTAENGFLLMAINGSENITIDNIKLIDAFADGIFIGGIPQVKNIKVRNVIVDNSRRNGIAINNCDGLIIEDSIIKNTNKEVVDTIQAGVDIEPDNNTEFVKNVVFNNLHIISNRGNGIYLQGSAGVVNNEVIENVTISNCTLTDNCKSATSTYNTSAITVTKTNKVSIYNNKVSGLNGRGGIYIDASRNHDIHDNYVCGDKSPDVDKRYSGIAMYSCVGGRIHDNIINDSNYYGLFVYVTDDADVHNNIITGCIWGGFAVESVNRLNIHSNRIKGVNAMGINILNAKDCEIYDNLVIDSNVSGLTYGNGAGIFLGGTGADTTTGNIFKGNKTVKVNTTPSYAFYSDANASANYILYNMFKGYSTNAPVYATKANGH
jgi:parallel beta-helix repeat protein